MDTNPNSTQSLIAPDPHRTETVSVPVEPGETIGVKRPTPNGNDAELVEQLVKKSRLGDGSEEDMRRVAEIVLVLSTMGAMRVGRKPTAVEVELMSEARAKIGELCKQLAPMDIMSTEAVGSVIEDLGFNGKIKDQKLGFGGPKLTITEKLSSTKKKMEEAKKFTAHSATYSSHPSQQNLGTVAENRGTAHTVRMFPPDKSSNVPNSVGGFPAYSPLGHAATSSAFLPHQLPANEVKASTVSSALPVGQSGKDSSSLALPRVERAHLKVDGGSSMPSYIAHTRANSSADRPLVNAPTWSVNTHSASLAKIGPESKLPNYTLPKVDGTSDTNMTQLAPQAAGNRTFRPYVTQTASGNLPSIHQPLEGINFVNAPPPINDHNEIAKIVQKVLQPKLPVHPTWIPPSREYMNKAFACKICHLTIAEVDNVLLCDACEKGYHIKCVHPYNQKGIPWGEWHCPKCLQLSNGKALPPKYGRVMRNTSSPKLPTTGAAAVQSSSEKVATPDSKLDQQKITANGSSSLQSPSVTMGSNSLNSASDSKIRDCRETSGNNISSSRNDMDDKSCTRPNMSMKSFGETRVSSTVGLGENSMQRLQISESSTCEKISVSNSKMEPLVNNNTEYLQASDGPQNGDQMELPNSPQIPPGHGNTLVKDLKKSNTQEHIAEANPARSSETSTGAEEQPSDGLRGFEWIGEAIQVVDGKIFYQSCRINGVDYEVHDHALFHSDFDKLMPSKLQIMWEDGKTGSKWVTVNKCFFPSDLPEAVGHPCTPETTEVYNSNHESTLMASLIQGPCEVLPPSKYREESERRARLGTVENSGLPPVYLCKWFYDELKGSFRPVCS